MLKKSLAVRERLAEALADAGIDLEEGGGRGAAAVAGEEEPAPGPPKRAAEAAGGGGRLLLREAGQARGAQAAEEGRWGEGEYIVLEESARPSAAPPAPAKAPPPARPAQRVAVDPFSLLEDPQLADQEKRTIAQALWRKLGPNPAFLRFLDYLAPDQVAEVLRSVIDNPQTEVEKLLAEALLKLLGGHGGVR